MTESKQQETRKLCGADDFCSALLSMLEQTRRALTIYSENLPPALYHNPDVTAALSAFARRNRYTQVRILIQDSDALLHRPHRLLALSQRLSSKIDIRKVNPTVETPKLEFAVGDDNQIVLRDDSDQWSGIYQPHNPARAKQLLGIFEQSWPLATQDENLRRLSL